MAVKVAAGDAALEPVLTLFERYQGEVYAYLYRMLREREWAEDLAQETFLRALRARRQLPQIENPRAWLYRIATNLALNALKRRRRFAWLPWRAADGQTAKEWPGEALDQSDRVESALAALSADLRAPLLLYAHHGFSVAEVAEALKLSRGAVKMRLYRAREAFRQAYARGDAR